MGNVLSHKATWFVLGAVVMYFAYPTVTGIVGGIGRPSQG